MEPDPLGPRTIPGVLDGAFAFMRAEAPTVLRVTAVLAVPMSLLAVYLQRRLLGDDTLGDLLAAAGNETNGPSEGQAWSTQITLWTLSSIQVTLVAAALTPLVVGRFQGERRSAAELLSALLRRLPAVAVAWVLVNVMEVLGLVGVLVGSVAMMLFCTMVIPILINEKVGPFRAIGRSFRATAGQFGRVIAVAVLMLVVVVLVDTALTSLPGLLAQWLGSGGGIIVLALTTVAADLLLVPFTALATILLYLDVRVRTNGLDLDHMLDAAGAPQ